MAKMERVCGPCFVESKNPDGPSGDEGTCVCDILPVVHCHHGIFTMGSFKVRRSRNGEYFVL